MKTLNELKPLILEWANKKDLLKPENAPMQRLKLIEECGELAGAIVKNNIPEQKDAIGDIFVVLVILNEQLNKNIKIENLTPNEILDISRTLIHYVMDTDHIHITIDYLNDISIKLNHDLTECANLAWNVIKDRKGSTINGSFIKN